MARVKFYQSEGIVFTFFIIIYCLYCHFEKGRERQPFNLTFIHYIINSILSIYKRMSLDGGRTRENPWTSCSTGVAINGIVTMEVAFQYISIQFNF